MKIEMAESLIYSWLRHEKKCQLVQNNWKASPNWKLVSDKKLQKLLDDSRKERFFENQSISLQQIIKQAESDAIGISIQDNNNIVYAVDVAFHENGLNYGSKKKTIKKICEKCLRTAMCLYGFVNIKRAEIIFASPKVGRTIEGDLQQSVNKINQIIKNNNLDYCVQLIANDAFKQKILDPVLKLNKSVADTSELFLRSYQLTQMFDTL